MTDPELKSRLAKFAKRAPFIASQQHLDKIMASFEPEHRPLAIERVSGVLSSRLTAREDAEVEVKPKDPEKPTVTEETVMRLNAQAAQILSQRAEIERLRKDAKEAGALSRVGCLPTGGVR